MNFEGKQRYYYYNATFHKAWESCKLLLNILFQDSIHFLPKTFSLLCCQQVFLKDKVMSCSMTEGRNIMKEEDSPSSMFLRWILIHCVHNIHLRPLLSSLWTYRSKETDISLNTQLWSLLLVAKAFDMTQVP